MSRKTLRIFMCAAVAAALGMFGAVAEATFYGGDFDPPPGSFAGHFLLNVSDSCISDSPGCQIDLVSLEITSSDSFGAGWFSNGQTDIASSASFDGGLHFLSDVISLSMIDPLDLEFAGFGHLNQDVCDTPSLMFTPGIGANGFVANLGCFSDGQFEPLTGDTATYIATVVPEPGTLVLLVGGIGAAWLARRRKTIA